MDKTYVVYSEEYYFSLNSFSTVEKKHVYNVSYNAESAEEVKEMISETLRRSVDSSELNSNNEMLTTFQVSVITLDGIYTPEEAREQVIDDDYTWGKVGRIK